MASSSQAEECLQKPSGKVRRWRQLARAQQLRRSHSLQHLKGSCCCHPRTRPPALTKSAQQGLSPHQARMAGKCFPSRTSVPTRSAAPQPRPGMPPHLLDDAVRGRLHFRLLGRRRDGLHLGFVGDQLKLIILQRKEGLACCWSPLSPGGGPRPAEPAPLPRTLMASMYCLAKRWLSSTFSQFCSHSSRSFWGKRGRRNKLPPPRPTAQGGPTAQEEAALEGGSVQRSLRRTGSSPLHSTASPLPRKQPQVTEVGSQGSSGAGDKAEGLHALGQREEWVFEPELCQRPRNPNRWEDPSLPLLR